MWVYLRKERFPNHWKSKLQLRGNGPSRVEEKMNDNAYKIDFRGKYGAISDNFNVFNLSLYHGT